MKKLNHIWKIVLLLSLVLALSACGSDVASELQQDATPTEIDPVAIFTSAAATVGAQMTQTAAAFSPTPTETAIPQPTATLIQLDTPVALATATLDPALPTLVSTATQVTIINTPDGPICDALTYGSPVDINYPDNSEVPAGTNFEKIWRIYNSGVCTWDDGYILVPVSQTSDPVRGGDTNPLDAANPSFALKVNVAPGEVLDVGAKLTAPLDNGTYSTTFLMMNDRGVYFGGPLTVIIVVVDGK